MTSPLVARKPPEPFLSGEPTILDYDYPDWGDVLTDIDKYGGSWPDIFDKNPKKSPTIGPYPEIGNDAFKQNFEWISKSDLPPEMKERLLGTLAQQVLLPKGKITTPEELGKFLEVTAPHFREALAFQRESTERLARQKAISNLANNLANTVIEGNRNVAIAGLPHKDYVSGHGLTAGVGKPSNIMRTYFG